MSRLGSSSEEREQTLREIEAELDSELGTTSTTRTSTSSRRAAKSKGDGINWGVVALGGLGTYIATKVLAGLMIKLLLFGSVVVFLLAGGLWLWNQFTKDR